MEDARSRDDASHRSRLDSLEPRAVVPLTLALTAHTQSVTYSDWREKECAHTHA